MSAYRKLQIFSLVVLPSLQAVVIAESDPVNEKMKIDVRKNWDEIHILSKKLQTSTEQEIEALDVEFHAEIPPRHRQFLQLFGRGSVCEWLHVFHVAEIRNQQPWFKKWCKEYGFSKTNVQFFKNAEETFTDKQVESLIYIANSCDGDMFVLLPGKSVKYYMLPRHDDNIAILGSDLDEVIASLHKHQRLAGDGYAYFESYVDQERRTVRVKSTTNDFEAINQLLKDFQNWTHVQSFTITKWDDERQKKLYAGEYRKYISPEIGGSISLSYEEHSNSHSFYFLTEKEKSETLPKDIMNKLKEIGFKSVTFDSTP